MNSSNSFNICPHCNNSNSLNARFCARCGAKLVVPQEVVVCHKCHTRNSPLANFCRNCGTPIRSGAMTKICPKCGREVPAEENVCACGHSFATAGYVSPDTTNAVAVTPVTTVGQADAPADAKADKKAKKQKNKKLVKYEYKTRSKKSGRAFAIVAALLLLVFAYAIILPVGRFLPSRIDGGFTNVGGAENTRKYLWDEVIGSNGLVDILISAFTGSGMGAFKNVSVPQMIMLVSSAILAITMVMHLLVVIIRIFSGRRSKKGNWFFLVMAILTTIVSALGYLLQVGIIPEQTGILGTILGWFDSAKLGGGMVFGTIYIYVVPAYYWLFYIYSLIAKRGRKKIVGEVQA